MIRNILSSVEITLLLSVAALHIVTCPFNKVEESFNTQAVHDIINIFPDNFPLNDPIIKNSNQPDQSEPEIAIRSKLSWDHLSFPGVVPRTFIGALVVGLPLKIVKYFLTSGYLSDDDRAGGADMNFQFILQIGSRFALSSFVMLSLSAINRAIHKRYGLSYRFCFLIATVTQFHYMFYSGRFLPNTFACILANLTFASWINRQYSKSIVYIALCVIIFRFDTSIFFGWLILDGVFIKRVLPLSRLLKVGIPAGLMAILLTFVVDSLFWARPVWPEFEGLYFNIWLNKSHEWGTQPYSWYIYSCLPRMMLACSPFIFLADHKITRDYMIPVLAFIFTYSLLPHKELRFILFVAPLLNICVASGLMNVYYYLNKTCLYLYSRLSRNQAKNDQPRRAGQTGEQKRVNKSYLAMLIFTFVLFGMFVVNMMGVFILARVSSYNYPGGQAATYLSMTRELLDHAQTAVEKNVGLQDPRSNVGVYVNNLAAQTGMSRFVQVNGAYYSKSPKLDTNAFKKSYKLLYLILEPKEVAVYLKSYCPPNKNQGQVFDKDVRAWASEKGEVKCDLPNQPQMYCSIIDRVRVNRYINSRGEVSFPEYHIAKLVHSDRKSRVEKRDALYIVRCSLGSRFNPFS